MRSRSDIGWHVQPDGTGRGAYIAGHPRHGWVLVSYFTYDGPDIVLADLVLFPGALPDVAAGTIRSHNRASGEPAMTLGRWLLEGHYLEDMATARESGAINRVPRPRTVHSALLRDIPLTVLHAAAREALAEITAFERLLPPRVARTAREHLSPERLGYLAAAKRYVDNYESHTNVEIAHDLGLSVEQLNSRLKAARHQDLGYLTSVGRGRRGGSLTERGRQLAAEHPEIDKLITTEKETRR